MTQPPLTRLVDQHTGDIAPVTSASAIRDIDALVAERDATRQAFATAVDIYDCPCGSEFEFHEASTLEDYAALNRWLGRHVPCPIVDQVLDEVRTEEVLTPEAMGTAGDQLNAIARAQQESADLREKLTNARCEIDDLQQQKRDMGEVIASLTKSEAAYEAERSELADELEDIQRDVVEVDELRTRVQELEAEAIEDQQWMTKPAVAR